MDNTALIEAANAMWQFASKLVEKHGMNGDDSMTDAEHAAWQKAAGDLHVALNSAAPKGRLDTGTGETMYFVTWEIDMYADSPREAAEKARAYQRSPESQVGVFNVFDEAGTQHHVDLDEYEEDEEDADAA